MRISDQDADTSKRAEPMRKSLLVVTDSSLFKAMLPADPFVHVRKQARKVSGAAIFHKRLTEALTGDLEHPTPANQQTIEMAANLAGTGRV